MTSLRGVQLCRTVGDVLCKRNYSSGGSVPGRVPPRGQVVRQWSGQLNPLAQDPTVLSSYGSSLTHFASKSLNCNPVDRRTLLPSISLLLCPSPAKVALPPTRFASSDTSGTQVDVDSLKESPASLPSNAAPDTDPKTDSISSDSITSDSTSPQPLSITEQLLQTRIPTATAEVPPQANEGNNGNSGDGSGGSEGAKDDGKNSWFTRNAWKISLGSVGLMIITGGGYAVLTWGAPKRDDLGEEVSDEFSGLPTTEQYLRRFHRELILFKEMIQEPSRPHLLPDPLTEPYYQPPYTLVMEMTGVLVHPDWTYRTGWRFKKRPQVEAFLQQVTMPLFEIVIFTSEHAMTAYAIIDNLDPNGYIMYRLFRDSTKYKDGVHHKDITHLNRDPKRVIVIDWDEKATSLQPENALRGVDRWTGQDEDRTLMDLAAFLRAIAYSGVDDVRTVLAHYNQHENPLAVFKENQVRLAEEQETAQKLQQEQKKSLAGGAFSSIWGRRR